MNHNIDLSQLEPDTKVALRFLTLLSQCDESNFAFQTFRDKKDEASSTQANVFCGTFEEHMLALIKLNKSGAGVFVTVNQSDGKGRKTENITAVRALFVDLDGSPLEPVLEAPLAPHIVIESSPGRYHAYWIVEGVSLRQFSEIQKKLIALFQADPVAHDLPRVMRLPGFYHQKAKPFLTNIIQESIEQPFSLERFLEAFRLEFDAHVNDNINPVLDVLTSHKMIIQKQDHPQGCWTIKCPWAYLHSQQDAGTKYYEPHTNGYKNHGFKCFHSHCSSKTIHDLLVFLGINEGSIEPLPLHRSVEPARPFPIKALGSILGPAVEAMKRVIQAPDSICAQSVLATASLTTQGYANITIDGREMPLSEFYLTIAESGDRKSAADKVAVKAIAIWQKMLVECYRKNFHKHQIQKELWEARKKNWIRDFPAADSYFEESPPTPPTRPLLLVEEPTYEGIVKYFAAEGQPSIGLFSDDGGRFIGGHAMKQENRLKTLAGLSSLWDGKEISRMRSGDGDGLLYDKRLSLHLMIQEIVLSELMNDPIFDAQGFLPRCLIAFPRSMAGNRHYIEEDLTADPCIQRFYMAINNLLNRPEEQEANKPRLLSLTLEAKKLWISFHDRNDAELAEGQRYYSIRRFGSKAAEHVLRLSAAMALIENTDITEISVEYIERGITLIEYYLAERLRIHGFVSVDPDLFCATTLLKWLWKEGHLSIGLSTIYQFGPSGLRSADAARHAMKILANHGWVVPNANMTIDGKKHKEAWKVMPPQKAEDC